MKDIILGISAYYHDSAAAVVIDGDIVAAAQEERFSRIKNDSSFPAKAILSVLDIAGISPKDVTLIAFYEKNYIKFERLLETYHSYAPKGLKSFLTAMPVWIKEKLFMKKLILDELEKIEFQRSIKLVFSEHHLSHAASAFYPSPFESAAILTLDGVGEWTTASISKGTGTKITQLKTLEFPHSVGLLYSAFTYYCGFKVNEGEYKLMGLAPYGNPNDIQTKKFIDAIYSELADVRYDGSIVLNMDYFDYPVGLTMTNDKRWESLFGIPRKLPGMHLSQQYANLAYAIQKVTEDIILKMAKTAHDITGCENLVMAGGVSLNSVANGLLYKSGIFKQIWIQPASGDAGGALGAALAAYYIFCEYERIPEPHKDMMKSSLLGPAYENLEIKSILDKYQYKYKYIEDNNELFEIAAGLIDSGNVVGWFRGRMEYGPRALGSRSFLADARNPEMQSKLNLKIKFREGFRPFAPAVLEEEASEYFDIDIPSPYMLHVVPVSESHRKPLPDNYLELELMPRLYINRSDIPSVTHLDYSARIQTVSKESNPDFHSLIEAFRKLTGCAVIINTSFNVKDEPIVCSPLDALTCFMKTETDCLVLENFLIYKSEQTIISDETFEKIMT
ncbi:MAG: carbamoyltransferase [Candidatus Kapabacteria bacterium]|nr:carbamoyltransferase [Candidatus Kapabacteria bacterium]